MIQHQYELNIIN